MPTSCSFLSWLNALSDKNKRTVYTLPAMLVEHKHGSACSSSSKSRQDSQRKRQQDGETSVQVMQDRTSLSFHACSASPWTANLRLESKDLYDLRLRLQNCPDYSSTYVCVTLCCVIAVVIVIVIVFVIQKWKIEN